MTGGCLEDWKYIKIEGKTEQIPLYFVPVWEIGNEFHSFKNVTSLGWQPHNIPVC